MKRCKICDIEFEKPVNGYQCYKCIYRRSIAPKQWKMSKGDLFTEDECWRWIAKQYDNKLMTDMFGLSELITVYDSLGGSQQDLDTMKPGKQMSLMWEYVNNLFLKKYKKVLEYDF
jgi:hypothetical protein